MKDIKGECYAVMENPTMETIQKWLKEAKTIAIVGLSTNPLKTSHQIAQNLQEKGYRVIPVNPMAVGKEILGETVYADLNDIETEIDIINVFRPSEVLPSVAKEASTVNAKVFWAQLGLYHEEVPAILGENYKGKVIMNRCIDIDVRELL